MSRRSYPGAPRGREHRREFACFGGCCTVIVADGEPAGRGGRRGRHAPSGLLDWHGRFSRFDPDSELSRFNRDPRDTVPATPLLRRLVEAALAAARGTGGLVDATLGAEIERAGLHGPSSRAGGPARAGAGLAPPRAPAGPSPSRPQPPGRRPDGAARSPPARRRDRPGRDRQGRVRRRAGRAPVRFRRRARSTAPATSAWAAAAGPARGPRGQPVRRLETLHTFASPAAAIATSGIGQRSWLDADGRPAHHLLDPRTGRPAFTGIVQATALAPTAAEAETLAKAAVLSGPEHAAAVAAPRRGVRARRRRATRCVGPPAGLDGRSAARSRRRSASQARMSASTASRSGSLRISWKRPW